VTLESVFVDETSPAVMALAIADGDLLFPRKRPKIEQVVMGVTPFSSPLSELIT